MIKLFPPKCRDEIFHCSSSVWAGVVMNHRNTPAKYATSLILDRALQFFKCVATDTCTDCGAVRQEVHKQNAFSVPKICAHDFPSWSSLLEFHLCLAMKCASTPWTAASIQGLRATPMYCSLWLHGSRCFCLLHCIVSESQMYWPAVSNSSRSISGNQHAHNLPNLRLSDKILWRSDSEIWWKCRESDVMVNRLFSLTFSLTACTKSSFTTESCPLHRSLCTFSHPSLNRNTHLRTTELLVACSPYMSQSWRWVLTGFMFSIYVTKLTMNFNRFHFLRIQEKDYRQHFTCGGILYFLKHYKHKTRCVNTVWMSVNCVHALPHNQQTRHARTPSGSQCCSGNISKCNLFSG